MMSSTQISALPEEVLINIFENLHGNKEDSLIESTLVCKKWNRIISQTHCLMDKLKLNLVTTSFLSIAALKDLKLTRFYRHVNWNNCSERGITPLKIFNEISKLDHLTTLEISNLRPSHAELMKIFQNLSRCKFLVCLIFKDCYVYVLDFREIEKIQRIKFNSLRKLLLYKTNSLFLNFIKCNELDSFAYLESYEVKIRHFFVCQIGTFLNQLDRCDEVSMKIQQLNFDHFKPKFLWKKLSVICEIDKCTHPDAAAISGMKSFLGASTTNATAHIELSGFNFLDSTHNLLWNTILNSCKRITSLSLDFDELPYDLSQLQNLSELRKLRINANILEDVNKFSNFTRKLKNVTQLEMLSIVKYEFDDVDMPVNAALIYQKFFNQITELELDSIFVDTKFSEHMLRSLQYHPISKIICDNLIKFHIIVRHGLGSQLNELFLNFCQRNPSLRHLKVSQEHESNNISELFDSEQEALIGWYKQLREKATRIETCNVMIIQQEDQETKLINWRVAGVDEIELFGRSLTEDENRFFI